MIKIDSKKAKDTAEIFYKAVEPYVCLRLNFIDELLAELEKDDVKLEVFEKKFCEKCKNRKDCKSLKKIDTNTIKSLINPMLKKDYENKDIDKLRKGGSDIFDVKDSNGSKNGKFFYKEMRTEDKDTDGKTIYKSTSTFIEVQKVKEFFEKVKANLHDIITGNPEKLYSFRGKGIDDIYNVQRFVFIKEIIEEIFDYECLTGNGFPIDKNELKTINHKTFTSYDLTSRLGLSVCVYCNRNWIMTITKKMDKDGKFKVTNPQLDHFFSKSEFPLLRLSFYNLIPSCETCNARLKKDVEFVFNENLHPYMNGYKDNAKFKVRPKSYEAAIGKAADYKVDIDIINGDLKTSIEKNHDTFKINEIYEKHGDVISEIYRKKYVYNEKYLETLKETFPIKLSNQEVYKLLLNNYITEEDFHKRPFALLIHDLTKDLGII